MYTAPWYQVTMYGETLVPVEFGLIIFTFMHVDRLVE